LVYSNPSPSRLRLWPLARRVKSTKLTLSTTTAFQSCYCPQPDHLLISRSKAAKAYAYSRGRKLDLDRSKTCLTWVMPGITRYKHNESGLLQPADVRAALAKVCVGPTADLWPGTSYCGSARRRVGQPIRTSVSSGSDIANSYIPHGLSSGDF